MRTILLYILGAILLCSCSEKSKAQGVVPNYFTITIHNKTANPKPIGKTPGLHEIKFFIEGSDFVKPDIYANLEEVKTLVDTIKIAGDEGKHYKSFYNALFFSLFAKPGDNIILTLDAAAKQPMVYAGDGADLNNYYVKKAMLNNELSNAIYLDPKIQAADAKTLLGFFKTAYKKQEALLDKFNLDPDFKAFQLKENYYNYKTSMYTFLNAQVANTNTIPSKYSLLTKELEAIDYHDVTEYAKSPAYSSLVYMSYLYKFRIKALAENRGLGIIALEIIKELPKDPIKGSLVNSFLGWAESGGVTQEEYAMVMSMDIDTATKAAKKFFKTYNDANEMKGAKAPNFEYEDSNGNMVKLSDLRGSYVYIDIWATWCGPCKKEIPYLKKLEEDLKGKNIHFVSISVDNQDDKEKWMTMVKEKEMAGIQLFENTVKPRMSEFLKFLNIQGIPRFIIIDPTGEVYAFNAIRPSDPSAIKVLGELKI